MTVQTERAFPSGNLPGITARDYFAAFALLSIRPIMQSSASHRDYAAFAYSIADAMMSERAK